MASLLDNLTRYSGFQRRIAGQTIIGIGNTGLDLANLLRDQEDQFKPLDVDRDLFEPLTNLQAEVISGIAGPAQGKAAKEFLLNNTRAPETQIGEITEDAGSLLLGYLMGRNVVRAGLKSLQGVKELSRASSWGAEMIAGGAADFTLVDPDGPRMAGLIPEKYRPAILDYLAAPPDEDEGRLESRLKNALEGAVLGAAADGIVTMFKGFRQTAATRGLGDPGLSAVDHEVATGLSAPDIAERASDFLSKSVDDIADIDVSIRALETPPVPKGRSKVSEPRKMREQLSAAFEAALDTGVSLQDAVKTSINVTRLGFDDLTAEGAAQAIRTIENAGTHLESTITRRVQAHSEVLEKARKGLDAMDPSLKDLEKNLTKLKTDIAQAQPKLLMYRELLTESTKGVVEKASRIATGSDISDEALAEFTELLKLQLVLQDGVAGAASNAGRLLNSLKIVTGSPNMVPDKLSDVFGRVLSDEETAVWSALAKGDEKELRDLAGSVAKTDLAAVDAKALLGGLKGVNKYLNVIKGIRTRNMLSGLPTHAVGTISNTLATAMVHAVESPLAALMSRSSAQDRITLLGSLRGLRAGVMEPVAFVSRFAGHMRHHTKDIRGLQNKVKASFKALAVDNTSRIREELGDIDIRWDDTHIVARMWNTWAHVMDLVSLGAMEAVDSVAKNINFTTEATSIATSRGIAKGLRGGDLDRFITAQVEQGRAIARFGSAAEKHILATLVDRGMDPKEATRHLLEIKGLTTQSQTIAKTAVFQDQIHDPFLKGIETIINNQDSILAQLTKTFIVPFYRTPVKLLTFVSDRTPILNKASKYNREVLNGVHGVRAQQRMRAQVLTGSALYVAAGSLVASGVVTGKHRPQERDDLIAAGIPEYSIKVPGSDNKFISYQRADPFAVFLGIVADIHNLSHDADKGVLEAAASGTLTALTSNVTHKTFMKGLADLLEAFENPAGFGPYMLDANIRTTVPTLVAFQRTFEKVWNANTEEYRKQKPDPSFTELRGWVDMTVGELGVGRTYDMRDALGTPIKRSGLAGELMGFRESAVVDSPAIRELARLKRFPGNRELSFLPGFTMNEEEFLEFKKTLGEEVNLTGRLDQIVTSPRFQRLGNTERAKVLSRLIQQAREVGKAIQIRKNPELRTKVLEHRKQTMRALLEQSRNPPESATLEQILTTRRVSLDRETLSNED